MTLLAHAGAPIPPTDRATLRRFRQLVTDLGADLYLATIDERVAGLAHVTYARQLARAPIATLATLVVAEDARRHGVGTALLRFALDRARRRACGALRCMITDNNAGAQFLTTVGAAAAGHLYEIDVSRRE